MVFLLKEVSGLKNPQFWHNICRKVYMFESLLKYVKLVI